LFSLRFSRPIDVSDFAGHRNQVRPERLDGLRRPWATGKSVEPFEQFLFESFGVFARHRIEIKKCRIDDLERFSKETTNRAVGGCRSVHEVSSKMNRFYTEELGGT